MSMKGLAALQGVGLQAALVDLDGTLVDTLGDFAVALQRMLDGMPPPYCQHRTSAQEASVLVGRGSEHLVASLLSRIEVAFEKGSAAQASTWVCADRPTALQAYLGHYREINGQFSTVYAGAPEGLQALRDGGLRLACVTNKPTAFAEHLLHQVGLAGYFEFVLGGDATPLKKPHPMPLLAACERLGTIPARTLMVGDSANDAQAARAAGCPVLLVPYGYNHGEDIGSVDADGVIETLAALSALFRRSGA